MVLSPIDITAHQLTANWDEDTLLITVEYIAYAVAVAALVDVLVLYC